MWKVWPVRSGNTRKQLCGGGGGGGSQAAMAASTCSCSAGPMSGGNRVAGIFAQLKAGCSRACKLSKPVVERSLGAQEWV